MKLKKAQIADINELYKPIAAAELLKTLPHLFTAQKAASNLILHNHLELLIDTIFSGQLGLFEKNFRWLDLYEKDFGTKIPNKSKLKPNFIPMVRESIDYWIAKYGFSADYTDHVKYDWTTSMFDHTEITIRTRQPLGDIIAMIDLYNYGNISIDTYEPILKDGIYRIPETETSSAITDLPLLLTHLMYKQEA